jgi:hypothetical protein
MTANYFSVYLVQIDFETKESELLNCKKYNIPKTIHIILANNQASHQNSFCLIKMRMYLSKINAANTYLHVMDNVFYYVKDQY